MRSKEIRRRRRLFKKFQPESSLPERSLHVSRREQLEEMLKSDPDDVFLQYALAMDFISSGEHAEGIAKLESVIERDPNYVPAYFQQAQAMHHTERLDDARDVLTRGITVARQAGDAHAEREMTEYLELL